MLPSGNQLSLQMVFQVVVFTEMVHTSKTYIRGCSLVDAAWLQEIQPDYFRTHRVK